MAQSLRKDPKRRAQPESLPFTAMNYRILIAGLVTIVVGYWALAQSPWDGFLPLNVAPVLLVLGYCVIIPFGIIYRKKGEGQTPPETTSVS